MNAHIKTLNYGQIAEVKIGSYICPDGWLRTGDSVGSRGEWLVASPWSEAAEFGLPSSRLMDVVSCVNIKITGRTTQRHGGASFVRVQIEWVHDGEPNDFSNGWMLV